MLEVLDEPIGLAERPDAVSLRPLAREIRLEGVVFGYDADRRILRDLSLAIPAGSHVAIVGASGSGKSTIVNLLLRFWDPQDGRVLFDGHDLRDVALSSLRGQIGLVFQDTFVFDTTLRENVALAREGATDDDVVAAVRATRLESWVESLPSGLDTMLGERGVRMSGGQRQRLAIARALVRDPSLLILDEATSALDAKTEAEILETLDELSRGRTTISITHRLSLAARSDHVVVVDEGEIVEQGTHAELVRAGGPYQRLYDEQTAHVGARHSAGRDRGGAPAQHSAVRRPRGEGARGACGAPQARAVRGRDGCRPSRRREPDALPPCERRGRGRRVGQRPRAADQHADRRRLLRRDRAARRGAAHRNGATMPTELYSLARADFLALLERDPILRRGVQETMSARRHAFAQASRAALD